jgi:hypothetical protein
VSRTVRFAFALAVALSILFVAGRAGAQNQASATRRLITQAVDRGRMVILPGNTRPEANSTNDRGRVRDELPLDHLQLQLRLPAEKQQELDQLTRDQQDPQSPNYHKWLTPAEYNQRFSLAQQDVDSITNWLRSEGFTVNATSARTIDFSGTAGQVRNTFHTEIHSLNVNGESHIANMSDPQIPVALAPAIVGIVSLNDFKPKPQFRRRADFTSNGEFYDVVPADLATIYDLNPLFASGISGQGQTIVVLEDSDVYSAADWNTFRIAFGLASIFPQGSFSQIHPAPQNAANDCTDPASIAGDDAAEAEASLDAEWASAAAPSASILVAVCADTSTNFGPFIALENIINGAGTPPAIVSLSYGQSESFLGAATNAYINALYQQAASEGVSVFASSGDEGAARSDPGATSATHGINVSGLASTPYNVAVGGTDFGDTYARTTAAYWNFANAPSFGSAKSYVPEIPWNDSCGSELQLINFAIQTTTGLCNFTLHTTAAAGGGPSGCATGAPAISGVAGGTCAGYAKPAWQSVPGNPNDGVRDIPDVSLFAATGIWGHSYVFCWSDLSYSAEGAGLCIDTPYSFPPGNHNWSFGGGTSFAAPIMAGIQALINQNTGSTQGNPAPTYYALASAQYGPGGNNSCNSSLGNGVAASCTFYDVTLGDTDVPCQPLNGVSHNCYLPSGTYGVLSLSNSSYAPAFTATTGWDFATGIGTVNAYNLVNNWPSLVGGVTPTSGTPQTTSIQGQFGVPLKVLVKNASGNPAVGTKVKFSAPTAGPSATFVGGASVDVEISDSSGVATSSALTANTTAGNYTIVASVLGVSGTADFSLTNTPGPPASIKAVSGAMQSAATNGIFYSSLEALVADNLGNPVSGVAVTFAAPGSGPSLTFEFASQTRSVNVVTDASGKATASPFQANGTPGIYTVVATAVGLAGQADFTFSNTALTPSRVTIISGDNQTTPILTPFAAPLVVEVSDSGGNPISNAVVEFSVSTPSATFPGNSLVDFVWTNAAGIATSDVLTADSTSEAFDVEAGIPEIGFNAFALLSLAGQPAYIYGTAGGRILTMVSTKYPGLQVTAKDVGGNAVSNAVVTFNGTASGPGGSFASGTGTTNANGVATSPTFTTNNSPGYYDLVATSGAATGTIPFANVDIGIAQDTPGTVQVTRGTPTAVRIDLVPVPSGFPIAAATTFSCTVAAGLTSSSCTLSPASLAAGAGGSTTLTILTTTPSSVAAPLERNSRPRSTWPVPAIPSLVVAGILIALLARERYPQAQRLTAGAAFALVIFAAASMASCGGGSSTSSSPTSSAPVAGPSGTPTGPSSVTVTAVAGGDLKTLTLPINVN